MKWKKKQYRELMCRLNVQYVVISRLCLEHEVSQEISYINKDIQSALNYLGSAHDQLAALIKLKEGKCDE